ncbi:MAG: DUF1189 family protein [Candidatus Liptonbacteria bacterium]
MNFIQAFKQSFYSPRFYRELRDKNFWFSLKYFYSLAVILAFVSTIVVSIDILPSIKSFMAEVEPYLRKYPADLVVSIKSGKASTNAAEPYFIATPEWLCGGGELSQQENICQTKNFLAIDTKNPFSLEKMNEYNAFAWLTADSLVINQDGEVKINSLAEVPDTEINKQFMDEIAAKAGNISKKAVPIVLPVATLLLFLGMIIYFSKLIFLIFGALIVWIIGRVKKVEIDYGYAYRIGLHAITLGLILRFLEVIGLPNVPGLLTILFAACVWVNIVPENTVPVAEQIEEVSAPAEEAPPA